MRITIALLLVFVTHQFAYSQVEFSPEVIKSIQESTVLLEIESVDGSMSSGSGFAAVEPGIIVTNAHVVDMMDPDSPKPKKVTVSIKDAKGVKRSYNGEVLGADRGSDLAIVRIKGDNLPPILKIKKSEDLKLNDPCMTCGFPLGKQLGDDITVRDSKVSALRRDESGALYHVQIRGGLNPGNSGGPLIGINGEVIGIAVSIIPGTEFCFCVPTEKLQSLINGRILGIAVKSARQDANEAKTNIIFDLLDPLTRLKKIEFDVWTGDPGIRRPASSEAPKPAPGDGPRQRYSLNTTSDRSVSTAVPMPALAPNAKKVYYIQPIVTDAQGVTRYFEAIVEVPRQPIRKKDISLTFAPEVGKKRSAELRIHQNLRILTSRESFALEQDTLLPFKEELFEEAGTNDQKCYIARLAYEKIQMNTRVDGKVSELSEELAAALVDAKTLASIAEIDKDGSLYRVKSDMTMVPRKSQSQLKSLGSQIEQSMEVICVPLSTKDLKPGMKWTEERKILVGGYLPGSATIALPSQMSVTYQYLGVQDIDGKEVAVIELSGQVKEGTGYKAQGKVTGEARVNPKTGEVIDSDIHIFTDLQFRLMNQNKQVTSLRLAGSLRITIRRPI